MRRITKTYEVISEESAKDGDVADRGFTWSDGVSKDSFVEMTEEEIQHYVPVPVWTDVDDLEDSEFPDAVSAAAVFLKDGGVCEPSSSHFHPGVWYSTEATQDYLTGDCISYSFHLDGFTVDEQHEIFDLLTGKRCIVVD